MEKGRSVNVQLSANYNLGYSDKIYLIDSYRRFDGFQTLNTDKVPRLSWSPAGQGVTKVCFSEPVEDPILLFSTLGNINGEEIKLGFDKPYAILYPGNGVKYIDPYSLSGKEGFNIILFPGKHSCITIVSDKFEYYTNLTVGTRPPSFPVSVSRPTLGCGFTSATASVAGTTGGDTYRWNGGRTPAQPTNEFEQSGVYTVVATNQQGCTSYALADVKVVPRETKNVLVEKTICKGENFAGYSVQGVYRDRFKTWTGCDSIRTLRLTVREPVASFPTNPELCPGRSVTLTPAIIPGVSNVDFKWSTGATGRSITVDQTGVYLLTVQTGFCTETASVTVVTGKPPALAPDKRICLDGTDVQLDAGVTDPSLRYDWLETGQNTPTLRASAIGRYQVRVTTPAGCVATRTIEVARPPAITLESTRSICQGEQTQLIPVPTDSGQYTYRWSTGETTPTLRVSEPGTYQLTVANGNCISKTAFALQVNPLPTVLPDDTVCLSTSIAAGSLEQDVNYLWSHSGETSSVVSIKDEGIYPVTITSPVGCSVVRTITVSGICASHILAPTGFTPNADGMNDVFTPAVVHGDVLELTIYNRWGVLIYSERSDRPAWDGTQSGQTCPNGLYNYRLVYRTVRNRSDQVYNGTIVLLR